MTDHQSEPEADALRRVLRDAAEHLPPPPSAAEPVEVSIARAPRWRRPLVGALGVLLVIAAVPIGAALLDDGDGRHGHDVVVDDTGGKHAVLQALAATVDSGSYDLDFTFHVERGQQPSPCPTFTVPPDPANPQRPQVAIGCADPPSSIDVTGHGTVNTSPYAMTIISHGSTFGDVTLFVNASSIWQSYGTATSSNAGAFPNPGASPNAGSSLSGFASTVEGALGKGQGALSMISLANQTGYLGLESDMVTGATADGTGTLDDGTQVTYYRVDVDITKIGDSRALSDEQRQAITQALDVLHAAGYSGSEERIGVDAAGFIRDVVATTNFSDGTSMTRHSSFSNFGCAKRVTMPNEAVVDAPAGTCPPVPASTTTSPATTLPVTSTLPSPTTVPPTTVPATSPPTLPPTTTTEPAPSTTG